MTNHLAEYSLLATYSAMAVLTLALIGFLGYLAGLAPARSGLEDARAADPEGAAEARRLAPVGSARASRDEEMPRGGIEHPDPAVPLAGPSDVAGAIAGVVSLRARKAAGIAEMLTRLGALLLVAAVVMRGLAVQRWPLGNMFEFSLMSTAFVTTAFGIWSARRNLRWLGAFVVGPMLLTLGMATTVWYTEAAALMPSLQSYWLIIHVTIATLSVALFGIGAALNVLYLWQERVEHSGRASLLNRFPGARSLERLAYSMHVVAFPLWTFTLIAGAIWARQAWGSYWNWDPKEVWSFVIWVVYAAYLHARVTSGWRRRNAALIALAGFACIVVNYGIVNVFFVSQHSYSGL